MQQTVQTTSPTRDQWEAQCLAAMLKRERDVDPDEAKQLVHAAWSIERFRTLAPILAAEELLANPGIRPGHAEHMKMPPN
jgi:hypothetical protein